MALKDSQISMYQHSEVKVRLLKLYLERYLNILNHSRYVGDIFLYDLFCGEGNYENGGKGSPIAILETIKNIHFSNVARDFRSGLFNCYFNDIDKDKIKKLESLINEKKLHYPEIGNLHFSSNDYRAMLPALTKELNRFSNQKSFIFIDPYGYKDIKVSDIKELLKSKKSEVLLFLPTQFMFRFEKVGTPESLKNFIFELVPEKDWPKSSTGIDFIEKLKDGFRESLGNDHFVDSFIITRDKNQFFCLFFFTSHIYGFEKMLESKWSIDEEEGRGWTNPTDNNLFSEIEKTPNIHKLENNLKEYIRADFRTNGKLYEFTLRNGYLPKHCSAVLAKLFEGGLLDIEVEKGKKTKKGSFYINYKNWKSEPIKITVKLK